MLSFTEFNNPIMAVINNVGKMCVDEIPTIEGAYSSLLFWLVGCGRFEDLICAFYLRKPLRDFAIMKSACN